MTPRAVARTLARPPLADYYTADSAAAWLLLDTRKIRREVEPSAVLHTAKGDKTHPLYAQRDLIAYAQRLGLGVPA